MQSSSTPVPGNHDLAAKFLQNVRGAVPLGIEQIDTMLGLIVAAREKMGTFLDLGCGDGVVSAALLHEFPEAFGVLVDLSEPMLDVTRAALPAHTARTAFVAADFLENGWHAKVAPHAPFDVIASAFSLHALPETRKRAVFADIFALLKEDGLFINIEHVASATRWTQSVLEDYMIDAIFGPELKTAAGKSRAEVAREYYGRLGKNPDVPAPLEVQLDWLRECGFENVECFRKVEELAMFGGQRPGAGTGEE